MTKKSKSEPQNKAALRLKDFNAAREPKVLIPAEKSKSKIPSLSKPKKVKKKD
jgi:hypothetical protein